MELYVDIADLDAVQKVAEYFPIDGFTTNPKILADAKRPAAEMMAEYKAFVKENNLKIFFQVTGETAEEMTAQAKALQAYYGQNLVIKLPAVKEGYKAICACKAAGIPVCVTVIHSMMQALVAAKAGADYVAPYISHIDNLGADGIGCVAEMVEAFRNGGYPCKVLGASFRTIEQLKGLSLAGCQAVTIRPEMFDALIAHPSTDNSMKGFREAWVAAFHTRQISDLIPE